MSGNSSNYGKICVFCGSRITAIEPTRDRLYHRCADCGGIFLDQKDRLDGTRERERYLLHDNTVENTGYNDYLLSFLDAVFNFPAIYSEKNVNTWRILDYGSGPCPALALLLRERGYEVRAWDPFFAPDTHHYAGGADLVTCLEVAEHFFEPRRDFDRLSRAMHPGGFLALGTRYIPETPFDGWWYRQDPTHVSFYTPIALSTAAASAGLVSLGDASRDIHILRKPGNP